MKKMIAFLSALSFLGSSTLTTIACGVSKGEEIAVNIVNPPEKVENGQDPVTDYVYNNKYNYLEGNVKILIALAAQLASNKIRYDNGATLNSNIWKEFYTSQVWRQGYFSSFNYEQTNLPADEQDFSFRANGDEDLITSLNNNDASVDNNKLRVYWFVTSANPWSSDNEANYQPTKNNIKIPKLSEFSDKTNIIRKGWLHFYLIIGNYQIDFSAEINFNFMKVIDKNGIPVVVLDMDTFMNPFGKIDINHPEETFNERIVNLSVKKTTN